MLPLLASVCVARRTRPLEAVALRQQLAVYERKHPQAAAIRSALLGPTSAYLVGWSEALILIKGRYSLSFAAADSLAKTAIPSRGAFPYSALILHSDWEP